MKLTGDFLIFFVAQGFCGVLCVLISRWFVWPKMVTLPQRTALEALLWPHTFRFINLAAATRSQVDPRVPHPWIAEVAWGDFAAAVLALVAIIALRNRSPLALGLAWLATVVGLLDFANSLGQGLVLGTVDLPIGPVWTIAVAVVPPLIAAHVMAVLVLRRPQAKLVTAAG